MLELAPSDGSNSYSVRMHRFLLLLTCVCVAFSSSAQFPYDRQLHRVTPTNGPVSGGTTVTIEGELNFSGLADPCLGPQVYVGGRSAQVTSGTETAVRFITPPYTTGTFDVVVDTCGARGVIKNAFTYGDPSRPWERVLLPVFLMRDLPGAYGSMWRSELAGYNGTGGSGAYVADHPESQCPSTGFPTSCSQFVGNGTFVPFYESDQHVPGRMIYVSVLFGAKRVALSLRVRDVSRESSSLGTELRPVFEDDAFGPYDQFALPNVPLGPLYREKLRIYQLDVAEGATVDVGFYQGRDEVAHRTLKLSVEPLTDGFLLYPGYAELDLNAMPELTFLNSIDVLVAVTEGRYWGYLSVTNNKTQQVTAITP